VNGRKTLPFPEKNNRETSSAPPERAYPADTGLSVRSGARDKSFFASFFSKKEDSSFSEEKEAKRLLLPGASPRDPGWLYRHAPGG
jgi:hypothetical protein